MFLATKFLLLWRRFTPLEEQLFSSVRSVLPSAAIPILDAQLASVTLVQRHLTWTEVCYFRKRRFKVDWDGVPLFARRDEFRLAKTCFLVNGRRYKSTLTCIQGHIFDFATTPGPKSIAFLPWDAPPQCSLLNDPLHEAVRSEKEIMPSEWVAFLERHPKPTGEWVWHDCDAVHRMVFDNGEYLLLGECVGEAALFWRVEPTGQGFYFQDSHDSDPEPLKMSLEKFFGVG